MESLFEHPHLLDGALGRATAYLAIAILIGLLLWEHWLKTPIAYQRHFRLSALCLGLTGLLIAVNNTALEAGNPFNADAMALPEWTAVLALLQNTHFGKAWLAYMAFLVLTVLGKGFSLRVIAIAAMLMALVLTSHAGDGGLWHAAFWVDYVHLLLALSWLGGLTVLITLRLGKQHAIKLSGLQFFSKLALPVFILILASGVMQVILRIILENKLNPAYIAVLSIKLVLVAAIMLSAWVLRQHLKRNKLEATPFDNGLSLEFFFALVLLLTTGLLAQIPPS